MQTLKVDSLLEHPRQREFFTPLEGQDWAKFVQDISERGILQALIVSDRDGHLTVCDGHQRLRAAQELEWDDVPVSVQSFPSEIDEVECMVMNNVRRRQLSRDEMDRVIGYYLKLITIKSNRVIADKLGVSHHTVEDKRQQLESTGQIAQLDRLEGADGRYRPRSNPRVAISGLFGPPKPNEFVVDVIRDEQPFVQVEYLVVDTETGEIIPESQNATRVEREYGQSKLAPFETRTVTLETPAGESQASKTLRKALYLLCEISESDLRQALNYEPLSRQMARDILEKLEGALEVKGDTFKTITVEAKAVN